jgi:hypothetical protein
MSTADSTSSLSNNLPSTSGNNGEISLKVRTIDQKTYQINIIHDASVPQLKESIEDATGVVIGRQRLIFRGRVLKNDQKISAYSLEDGHVLHLVVRAENTSNERDDAAENASSSSRSSTSRPLTVEQVTNDDPDPSMNNLQPNRVLMGATITVPEGSDVNMPFLSSMIANIMNSVQGTMGRGTVIVGTEPAGSRRMNLPSTTRARTRRARGGRANANGNNRSNTPRTTTTTRAASSMGGAPGGDVSSATSNLRQRLEAEMETIMNLLEHENYDFPNLSQRNINSSDDADAAFIQSQIQRAQQLLQRFNDRMQLLPVALDEIHTQAGNREQQQPLVYPTLRAIETMQSLGESLALVARLARHHFLRWTTAVPTTTFQPTSIILEDIGLASANFPSSIAIPFITSVTTNTPPINISGTSPTSTPGVTTGGTGRRVRNTRNSRATATSLPIAGTGAGADSAGSIQDAFMQQILGSRVGITTNPIVNSTGASSSQPLTGPIGSTAEVGVMSGFFPSFVAPLSSLMFPISLPNTSTTTTTTASTNATRHRGTSRSTANQTSNSMENWNLPNLVSRLVHNLPSSTFYGVLSGDPNSLQQLMASLGVALSAGIDVPVLSRSNIRPWCENFWNALREDFILVGTVPNNETWESLSMRNLGQGFDTLMGPVRSFIPDLADQVLRAMVAGDTAAFGEQTASLLQRLFGEFFGGLLGLLQNPGEVTNLLVSYLAFRGINERMARFMVENVVAWSDSIISLSSTNVSNISSSRRSPRNVHNEEESESTSSTVAAKRRRR